MAPKKRTAPIVLALVMALALGSALCWLSRPNGWPALNLGGGDVALAFWSDDLRDRHGLWTTDAALTPDGLTLSHLRRLGGRLRILASGPGGYLYGQGEHGDLTAYDTASGKFIVLQSLLGAARSDVMTVAPNGRLYGVTAEYAEKGFNAHQYLFEYDPRSGALQIVTEVVTPTWLLAAGRDGRIYGLTQARSYHKPAWRRYAFDPVSRHLQDFGPAPVGTLEIQMFPEARVGDDGVLYGEVYVPSPRAFPLFALDLTTGMLVTQTVPFTRHVDELTPRPGGSMYAGINGTFWLFDPRVRSFSQLPLSPDFEPAPVEALAVLADGRLIGSVEAPDYYGTIPFTYDPVAGHYERIEYLPNQYPIDDLVRGPDGQVYTAGFGELELIDPSLHADYAEVTSEVIQPTALVLTRTEVSGPSSVTRALACTGNGRVYGVLSSAQDYFRLYRPQASLNGLDRPGEGQWLFWYDAGTTANTVVHVAPGMEPGQAASFLGGTALVALPDGRLAGSTNYGRLFVYDPATQNMTDFGLPNEQTWQIATLSLGRDGLVYGGTASYERAILFSFDPQTGKVVDLGAMVPSSRLVGAVASAPDGRILAGAGAMLVVYDPATHQRVWPGGVATDPACNIRALVVDVAGRTYGSCGDHLFAYAPGAAAVQDLGRITSGPAQQTDPQITALVLAADGQLYGSVERNFRSDAELFVYNPLTQQARLLGMAVPGSIMALTRCGDGSIYAGSGTNDSTYSGPGYLFAFSPQCPTGLLGHWERVVWDADVPTRSQLEVDVLDERGGILLANVQNGETLRPIDVARFPRLKLRARLATTDPRVAPVLHEWRVEYAFQCQR